MHISIDKNPPPNPIPNANADKKHGGQRENAGRPKTGAKECKQFANAIVSWIDNRATATGGDSWKMSAEERKNLADPLGSILVSWDVKGTTSPYAALLVASVTFAFGNAKRANTTSNTIANFFTRIKPKKWWQRNKKPAAPDASEPKPDDRPTEA